MAYLESSHQPQVRIAPADMVERQFTQLAGLGVDLVTAIAKQPFEYRYTGQHHLLIANDEVERHDGESSIEGLPTSTLRSISGHLTFVPSGHEFKAWQNPSVLTRVNYFYIDPKNPLFEDLRFNEIDFSPRLFFTDSDLWQLAAKLRVAAARGGDSLNHYGEALVVLLGHELTRLNGESPQPRIVNRGGLGGWQRKRVIDFIEENLANTVRLATLAGLVDLSPYHFARAFKQSFGVPPHRYHVRQRIERAKALLQEPDTSVTAVASAVGFAETSSFSTAFRKVTGSSPREFRRGLA
jgi:AraC-like DNA-binding protein